jgi:hypothetical protein
LIVSSHLIGNLYDDDDKEEGGKEFDLARCTGEIMDRYREYIIEIGSSSSTSGSGNSDSKSIAAAAMETPTQEAADTRTVHMERMNQMPQEMGCQIRGTQGGIMDHNSIAKVASDGN